MGCATQSVERPGLALTRAEKLAVIVGDRKGLWRAVRTADENERYTRLAGESPRSTHARRQFQRACALLEERSVQETADALGFCDPYHFAHRFHQCVGMWPSEYRRRVGRSGSEQ